MIEDIRTDCEVARRSLERPAYRRFAGGEQAEWLRDFGWVYAVDKAGDWGEKVEEVEREVVGGG